MAHAARTEPLESRRLLSVALSDDGTLTVTGSDRGDLITFQLKGPPPLNIPPNPILKLDVRINDESTVFTADQVRRIVVDAAAGDDTVKLLTRVSLVTGVGGADPPPPVALSIDGGEGDDDLVVPVHDGPCELHGGPGNDRLEGPGTLDGGGGQDLLIPRDADHPVPGYSPDERGELPPGASIRLRRGTLRIVGTPVADTVACYGPGTTRPTLLVQFNDAQRVFRRPEAIRRIVIEGGGGNDTLGVTSNIDDKSLYTAVLRGGTGRDTLKGGARRNFLFGEDGDDTLTGFAPKGVVCFGGAGDDVLSGAAGQDLLFGGDGNDKLNGLGGSDVLRGGAGDDVLDDYERFDFRPINAPLERDLLDGGAGADACVKDPTDRPQHVETFRPPRQGVINPL